MVRQSTRNEPASCRGNTGAGMTGMKTGRGRADCGLDAAPALLEFPVQSGSRAPGWALTTKPVESLLFIRTRSDLCTTTNSRQVPSGHLLPAGPGASPRAQGQQRGRLQGSDPRSALWRREGLKGPEARRAWGEVGGAWGKEEGGCGEVQGLVGGGSTGARSLSGLSDGGLHPKNSGESHKDNRRCAV